MDNPGTRAEVTECLVGLIERHSDDQVNMFANMIGITHNRPWVRGVLLEALRSGTLTDADAQLFLSVTELSTWHL